MELVPKYAESIIVGVKYGNAFKWYISDKELWYLDLRKLIKAFENKGFQIPNADDFSDRFNIDIVNEHNAKEFLTHMKKFIVETKELKDWIINKKYECISDMAPSIFIDFNDRILISEFPEPASFEEYVPDGWEGKYETFIDRIPEDHRYWLIEKINYFRR